MELDRTLASTHDPRSAAATEPGALESLARGAVIGRFVVLERIGAGAMGVVYAAYDPGLDRKIALKLVSPGVLDGEDAGRARLLREAQALAKLAHPNVVTIHDVGTHGDQVWIAMEFVAGQTLAAWARAARRRWPELLRVLTDAARGVVAAHAAGLIHRDLKPDNVMIDRDGRVRVMDFGLAYGRTSAADDDAAPTPGAPDPAARDDPGTAATLTLRAPSVALSRRLTRAGVIQGTPAYMAPEQWQGREVSAAADQFGWSAMAWELLYGESPFVGDSLLALAAAVQTGQRRPPPRGRRVPGWLRRVVERGLASDPAQRWPTMAALLAALERGRVRARVQTAAVVLIGLTAAALAAAGVRRWDLARRVAACEASGAVLDAAWNDDARQRVRDAFAATGLSFAASTADRVVPGLDAHAAAWRQARAAACQNAEVRGLWGPELLDRAVWCLEDRQMELEALAAEFGQADASAVQKAVEAVAGLRTVDACMDADLLRRQPAPPTRGREALRAVRAELSRAASLGLAGKFPAALAAATGARERAQAGLDWPPLWAAARAQEGHLLERTGAYAAAEVASSEAYFAAARAGAWEVAAAAATRLVFAVGFRLARHADGRAWAQHGEVALAHAGDREGLLEATRLNHLGVMTAATGAYAEARALHERALALRERALGPRHPYVAFSLNNLAATHVATGAYAEARALLERAQAIREAALGPDHPEVAAGLNNLAITSKQLGAHAEAQALYERALAINERALGPDHPDVAFNLNNLAIIHERAGAHAQALALHQRALEILEKALGPGDVAVARSLQNLGAVHQAMQASARARPLFERALAIHERALGPDHPDVALNLAYLADLDLAEDRPGDALPRLERAAAIQDAHDTPPEEAAAVRFGLARALLGTGADPARALALARRARDGYRAAGGDRAAELAAVERWLAARARDGE